jgi:glucose-1-phosphate cytidylyltransferase
MAEIGGKPILWHIMKLCAHHDLRDFVLCVGYKGQIVKEYFLNYQAMNNDFTVGLGTINRVTFHGSHDESSWTVTIADTGLETNTGGRVKGVQQYIDGDNFMVTYGDGVADINLRQLLNFHLAHGRIGTITTVRPLSRFGIVDLKNDRSVAQFREKPQSDDWVNAGFFVFNRRFFDYLDDDCILEREPLDRLSKDGQLMAFAHHGFWQPMDTYREFKLLNELWALRRAPWKVWSR